MPYDVWLLYAMSVFQVGDGHDDDDDEVVEVLPSVPPTYDQ